MIGRRCKGSNVFSRPVLIARNLSQRKDTLKRSRKKEVLSSLPWSFLSSKICGGYSGGVPPLPIPNREVKPVIADGSALSGVRVGSCRFSTRTSDTGCPGFLFVPSSIIQNAIYRDAFFKNDIQISLMLFFLFLLNLKCSFLFLFCLRRSLLSCLFFWGLNNPHYSIALPLVIHSEPVVERAAFYRYASHTFPHHKRKPALTDRLHFMLDCQDVPLGLRVDFTARKPL